MKIRSRFAVYLFCLMTALLFTIPGNAKRAAAETVSRTNPSDDSCFVYLNPVYHGTLTEEDLKAALYRDRKADAPDGARQSGKVYTTEKEAAAAARAFMVKRIEDFSIDVKLDLGTDLEKLSDEERDTLFNELMNRLLILSLEETDKPYEGDYLDQLKGFGGRVSDAAYNGSTLTGTLTLFIPLTSTAAQEKKVNEKIPQIMKELNLAGKSEYEKIKAIYDYMCGHITYDEKRMDEDISHTAYAAIVEGTAVCEGYAMAAYRLMREAGVGCRYINGRPKNGKGAGHAWNIVRIGNKYYYIDATWDTGLYLEKKPYQFFLKGSPDRIMPGHEDFTVDRTEDFWKKHPLSAVDYTDPYPAPSAPDSVKFKTAADAISFTWSGDANAVSYAVYRTTGGQSPKKIGTTTSASYTDKRVKHGKIYTYFIKAVGKNKSSALSKGFSRCFLSVPKNLKAKASGQRTATLTWKRQSSVTGYQIRYSGDKKFKKAKKVTIRYGFTAKYILRKLPKKTLFFQIRSFRIVNGKKQYSAWSKTVKARIR